MGIPGAEVETYVSGNHIRNTTEPAIEFRRVVGRVHIERNVLIKVLSVDGRYLLADGSKGHLGSLLSSPIKA